MPPIAVEGRPPIKTLEGMLDRGIQYFSKSKVTGFPLEFTLVKTGAGMTLKQDFFSNLIEII
jgi:hypothetical protein